MALLTLVVVAVAVVAFVIHKQVELARKNRLQAGLKRLPGPKGLPLIGNVHELPEKCSWLKFDEWAKEHGPIYQVNLAGQNHVWISRDKIAHDLLSKRSAIYSDRPHIPALEQDNRTSGQYLPLMSKNAALWTRQRKFAKQIMDKSQSEDFYNYPELESIRLLFELMTDTSRYNVALESFVARVTCRLAWGTSTPADELKQRARELLIGVSPTGALGNKLPFLMSLPEKIFAPKAWEARRSRTEHKFFESMQEEVSASLEAAKNGANTSAPALPPPPPKQSWMRTFIENKKAWGFASDYEGATAVGMHGIAGALTIAAPMQSFCLALCHHPQYQPMLHEEIDRVLGDRMPRFTDMPEMPVLRAFIRETLRWRPPVPTGIPHQLTKDDVYEGYHIPAGSVMHPLEWSISRDPEVFIDPDTWNPMRWLDEKYPTFQAPLAKFPTITSYSQFGYGRRTCQGMGVTEADLFVGIGSVAWLFSIHKEGENTPEMRQAPVQPVNKYTAEVEKQTSHVTTAQGIPTPPSEESLEKRLNSKLTMHRNDSAISMSENQRRSASPPSDASSKRTSTISSTTSAPSSSPATSPSTPLSGKPEDDPTLDFSALLIAKPKPFKFDMRIRNQDRADKVARQWLDLKMEGEFEDSRCYWKGGNHGDADHGWNPVWA
ncbi:hypothetical protein MBLNU230_g2470t1 [Neophaeotheca triangularis]